MAKFIVRTVDNETGEEKIFNYAGKDAADKAAQEWNSKGFWTAVYQELSRYEVNESLTEELKESMTDEERLNELVNLIDDAHKEEFKKNLIAIRNKWLSYSMDKRVEIIDDLWGGYRWLDENDPVPAGSDLASAMEKDATFKGLSSSQITDKIIHYVFPEDSLPDDADFEDEVDPFDVDWDNPKDFDYQAVIKRITPDNLKDAVKERLTVGEFIALLNEEK